MRKKIDMKYYEFLEKKGFLETCLNLSFQKILYFVDGPRNLKIYRNLNL